MSELSVFIDESGDLGGVSDYYLISLVFHNQDDSISERIDRYEIALAQRAVPNIPLHVGPLLNGHDEYRNMTVEQRKNALSAFRAFVQHLPFRYFCFKYKLLTISAR